MIHPDTELRFIHPKIGYGVVATRRIPKGTITWVHDELDQTLPVAHVEHLSPLHKPTFLKYAYIDGRGRYILCWDLGRFVNHSCEPNCMAPGLDFEMAIRDIEPGEQLTGDYATYNLETGFECHCGSPQCRGQIEPMDRLSLADDWDRGLREAFLLIDRVEQPLWSLVREKREIQATLADPRLMPSCRRHFYHLSVGVEV